MGEAFWGINNSGGALSWSTGLLLTGLNSGTAYYFVGESTGASGATGYSTTYSFTTTGTPGQ